LAPKVGLQSTHVPSAPRPRERSGFGRRRRWNQGARRRWGFVTEINGLAAGVEVEAEVSARRAGRAVGIKDEELNGVQRGVPLGKVYLKGEAALSVRPIPERSTGAAP